MKYFFTLIVVFGLQELALAGSGYVYLGDTARLVFVKNNEIYSPDGNTLLYFSKGNIFFQGAADNPQSIFLLASSMDVASETLQSFYLHQNKEEVFSFQSDQFYAGKNVSEDVQQRNRLLQIKRSKKWTAFYSGISDSLLAYYETDSLPGSTAVIVAYMLIRKFKLQESLMTPEPAPALDNQVQFSTIKPVWGNVLDNEWIWDGQLLRPRWSNDPRMFWTYDGQYIKPYYARNINLEYEWDGEYFKPLWRTSRPEEWMFDGRLIKPVYSTDWANQYVLDGGVLKPWSNVHTEKEWRVEGEIPVPVLILVISGVARGR